MKKLIQRWLGIETTRVETPVSGFMINVEYLTVNERIDELIEKISFLEKYLDITLQQAKITTTTTPKQYVKNPPLVAVDESAQKPLSFWAMLQQANLKTSDQGTPKPTKRKRGRPRKNV